ncbi:hypothetical protein BN1221_00619c [Brenneria goodwinii]|uniref:Uncharacterized protein n=1 Tax=Brenneria goodwinii TaxID=1109412 RepID=A0A0G4JQL6_9GAMM|nr:hypothetical protein BN1221_00619c [Brenneria goodwinii]
MVNKLIIIEWAFYDKLIKLFSGIYYLIIANTRVYFLVS